MQGVKVTKNENENLYNLPIDKNAGCVDGTQPAGLNLGKFIKTKQTLFCIDFC